MRIDNDIEAIKKHLNQSNIDGARYESVKSALKYKAAWQKRGYSLSWACLAVEWYLRNRAPSTDTRPKRVDDALGECVRRNAAAQYRFTGADITVNCDRCKYLSEVQSARGHNCDRLLIWVADPVQSSCPEWEATP